MNLEGISLEDKMSLIQKLFTPTDTDENVASPIILGLKPFDPGDVAKIVAIDGLSGYITETTPQGDMTRYQGTHGVNFLTEKGWKVCAMFLVNRPGPGYSNEVVQELITVLILPKTSKVPTPQPVPSP